MMMRIDDDDDGSKMDTICLLRYSCFHSLIDRSLIWFYGSVVSVCLSVVGGQRSYLCETRPNL